MHRRTVGSEGTSPKATRRVRKHVRQSKKRPGVKVRLVCKDCGKPTPTEIAKFNRQYKGLSVTYSDDFHDPFLIIDNVELHGLGSSINCLGRRVTSFTTRDPKEIAKLLAIVP